MTWSLNELLKPLTVEYLPGEPGVPGDPGRPAIPGYWTTETEILGGEAEFSTLPPNVTIAGFTNYRYFGSVLGELVGFDEPTETYIYQTSPQQTIITSVYVPGQAAIPPTPGTPFTPYQTVEDFNLGWDGGAIGSSPLEVSEGIKFRFPGSDVGAVVGVSRLSSPQDQSYRTITLGVVSASGQYSVIVNGAVLGGSRAHDDTTNFSISRSATGLHLVVNGALIRTVANTAAVIPDSSIYSANDRIWDAQYVTSNVGGNPGDPTDIPVTDNAGATTQSGTAAVAIVTPTFGPGTELGLLGSGTGTAGIVGSVNVNGTILTGSKASTVSATEGEAFITRTLGAGSALGVASASTASATDLDYSPALGSADLSFRPLLGAGASSNVFVGWTGDYAGDAMDFLPMTVESENGLFEPSLGIGQLIMVPMTVGAFGATGEVSLSCDCEMAPMQGIGSEGDYALVTVSFSPLRSYGTDLSMEGIGAASGTFRFELLAVGRAADKSTAILRSRNAFSLAGYGGGRFKGKAAFALEAEATGSNIGRLEAVIGYA